MANRTYAIQGLNKEKFVEILFKMIEENEYETTVVFNNINKDADGTLKGFVCKQVATNPMHVKGILPLHRDADGKIGVSYNSLPDNLESVDYSTARLGALEAQEAQEELPSAVIGIAISAPVTPQATADAVRKQMIEIANQQIKNAKRTGGALNPLSLD